MMGPFQRFCAARRASTPPQSTHTKPARLPIWKRPNAWNLWAWRPSSGGLKGKCRFLLSAFGFCLADGCAQYEDCYEKKKAAWNKKAPGIVAKMISNLKGNLAAEAFGIGFVRKEHFWRGEDELWLLWKPILMAKFEQNEEAREVLLSTGSDVLVEFSRFPGVERNFWGAYVKRESGGAVLSIQGRNMMGRFLMRVRRSLSAVSPKTI